MLNKTTLSTPFLALNNVRYAKKKLKILIKDASDTCYLNDVQIFAKFGFGIQR